MPLPFIAATIALGALALHARSRRPRNVFFSFHYDDVWKVNQVRNSWVTHPDAHSAGFFDRSLYEKVKTRSETALRAMIDDYLEGTAATVVLIGQRTHSRSWVHYEIEESAVRGNRLLGVNLHELRKSNGRSERRGRNPFARIEIDEYGTTFDEFVPVYDWVSEDGYTNLREWVRNAPTLNDILEEI